MAVNKNYVITLGTAVDISGAEKDLEKLTKKPKTIKISAKDGSVKDATASVKGLDGALKNQDQTLGANLLTFQAANMILSQTVDIVSAVVEQVYELNTAQTEFKKVSDLTGASLDNYTQKLSEMGRKVARTS